MRSAPPCCMLPLYVCATLGLALLVHLATAQTQPTPRLASLPWTPGSLQQQQQQQAAMLLPPVFGDADAPPETPRVTLCTLVCAGCLGDFMQVPLLFSCCAAPSRT